MPALLIVDDSEFDLALLKKAARALTDWSVEFARNGDEALAKLCPSSFDLLLTDLHMPVMDGLTLLGNVIDRQIDVPTVIMTSRGSESAAMEALQRGAVNFIPKRRLILELPGTVTSVMRAQESVAPRIIPLGSLQNWHGQFVLQNSEEHFSDVVAAIVRVADQLGDLNQRDRTRLAVALNEALTNAMHHGNLEVSTITARDPGDRLQEIDARRQQHPYRGRKISVDVRVSRSELACSVSDEGQGFDTAADSLLSERERFSGQQGHGLILMRTFMDACEHSDGGATVTLRKSLRTGHTLRQPTGSGQSRSDTQPIDPLALVEEIQNRLHAVDESGEFRSSTSDQRSGSGETMNESRIWV